MKIYQEKDELFISEGTAIPKDPRNAAYIRLQQEILSGKARTESLVVNPWDDIRVQRNAKIQEVQWEYERYAREQRLQIPTYRSSSWMKKLDLYVQTLAELPQTYSSNPTALIWPQKPE